MLLAYIDEIGETGAFVPRDHGHYNTSPAFGYAGFIIPEGRAQDFGAVFDRETRTVFKRLIEQQTTPAVGNRRERRCSPCALRRHTRASCESSITSCAL